MAAKTTLGKMKSSFQEMLEFSRRELKGGTGDIKGELITFAKRTTTLMKGQSQPPAEAIPSIVNPEVGGLILLHFLIVHSRLRDDITKSAHKASEADVTLQTLSKRTSSWYRLIEECDVEFRCVPDLIKSVLKAKAKVSDIHNELNRIHQSLYELEILNAKLDNERKKNSVLLQLKMHKMDKEKENKQLEGRVSSYFPVYPSTHAGTTAVHPSTHAGTTAVHPSTHASTTAVHPSTHASTTAVYPSTHASTRAVHPSTHASTTAVHPSTHASTTAVYPSTHASTTAVHPSTHASTRAVHPSTHASTTAVHPSTHASTTAVYSSTHASTRAVHPSTHASTTAVYPSTHASTTAVYSSTHASTRAVHPSTHASTTAVYPSTHASTTAVHPSTHASTTAVHPSTRARNVYGIPASTFVPH